MELWTSDGCEKRLYRLDIRNTDGWEAVGVWTAPEPPGPEVTHVRDAHGVVWRYEDGFWWGHIGHTEEGGTPYEDHREWSQVLTRGPLADASGEV